MVRILVSALVFLFLPSGVFAEVNAKVDRYRVDANESLTLTVTTDKSFAQPPDLEPLRENFELLSSGVQSVQASIVSGKIIQRKSFVYAMMPRKIGTVEVPVLTVAGEETEAFSIEVTAAPDADASGEDVFMTAELDSTSSWVQAQSTLRVRIFSAVRTKQANLKPPTIDGVEVIFEHFGDDSHYSAVMKGRSYEVTERNYSIIPQESGTVSIGEFVFSARIYQRSRLSTRRVYTSEPLQLEVKPAQPPPDGFPNAVWLPARSLQISESWNPADKRADAGEPLTRKVQIVAAGLTANQLPPLPETNTDDLRIYPDQPELETAQVADGRVAVRIERYAVIAGSAGSFTVPALALPWWNVQTAAWEIARLPASVLEIGAVPSAALAEPGTVGQLERTDVSETDGVEPYWFYATAGFATLWLMTVFAWWRSKPATPVKSAGPRETTPAFRRQSRLLREARSAALVGEPARVATTVLLWAEGEYEDAPKTLGALANRCSEPAHSALLHLSTVLYGKGGEHFDPDKIAQALSHLASPASRSISHKTDLLPELAP
ncbi:MAG: BatD family protein [Pseudomonadota bacterium]